MRWVRDPDISTFAAAALPWLGAEPVVNNVAYTLTQSRLDGLVTTEPDAQWLHAEDSSGIVAVALRTPPHGWLIAAPTTAAAESLAEHLHDTATPVPGINGPNDIVTAFVDRYTVLSGTTAEVTATSRIYRLDTVTPPAGVPGTLRLATVDDLELVVAWRRAFAVDTSEGRRGALDDTPELRDETTRRIRAGLVWFWIAAHEPVATAWLSQRAAGISRVSMVYTPRDRRGRGFASACVAAVSQLALDAGAAATILYTDLTNPITNRIYQRVGYRPVTDTTQWRFDT